MLWSNAWSSLWKQEFLSARYAVRVYGAGFDKSWLCCEKYRSVGYFHHCSVSADGRRLSLVCPLRMQDSIDCLLPLFDILSARNDPSLTVSLSRTHLKWHRGEDSAPYAEILHERTEQIMTISADVSTAVAATKRKRKQTDKKTAPRPKLPDNELRDAKRAARAKARRLLMKLSRAKPSDNGDVEADVNDNDSDSDESCVSNLSEELAKYIESDVESAGDMEGVEGEPGAAKPGKPAALAKVNAPPPLPPHLKTQQPQLCMGHGYTISKRGANFTIIGCWSTKLTLIQICRCVKFPQSTTMTEQLFVFIVGLSCQLKRAGLTALVSHALAK